MWSALAVLALQSASLDYWLTKVDITPPELLPLGGYTARRGKLMAGVGDRLYARGLILQSGKKRVAIVSCEMLTIPESLFREVKNRIPKDVELFLAATHTHSAPDSQMLNDRMTFQIPGIASYRPRWLTWYAERIANAVTVSSKPAAVSFLTVSSRQSDNNRARRLGGDPDKTYTVYENHPLVQTFGRRLPTALFASYAAHGTLYSESENVTRGDWPGLLASRLNAPVLVGAIGDVSPKAEGLTPSDRVARMVTDLSKPLPTSSIVVKGQVKLSFLRHSISLNLPEPHPSFSKAYGIPQSLAKSLVEKFAPDHAEISVIRIGKCAIVGIPGEPTSHLGRAIRDYGRTLGFESVLVVSHVNGWMGYILGPEDYDRGGYEATLNFYGREEGDKVVEAGKRALRELASNKVK